MTTADVRDLAREQLRDAIQRLEIEAYQHGIRNGRPNGEYRAGHFKSDPGIPEPVGAPHHAARTEVERLLNTAAKGLTIVGEGIVAVSRERVGDAIFLMCGMDTEITEMHEDCCMYFRGALSAGAGQDGEDK